MNMDMDAIEIIFAVFFGLCGLLTIAFIFQMIRLKIKKILKYKKLPDQTKIRQKRAFEEIEKSKKQEETEIENQRREISARSYCPYCGSKHPRNTKTCNNCGADI